MRDGHFSSASFTLSWLIERNDYPIIEFDCKRDNVPLDTSCSCGVVYSDETLPLLDA